MCLPRVTKIHCLLFGILFCTESSLGSAAQTSPFQHGKIITVVKHDVEPPCCYSGTDVPPQSDVVEYDISVEVGDITYVGGYETWTSYVPITCAKNHEVEVRTDKHFIYLKALSGQEIRLHIVSRKRTDHNSKTSPDHVWPSPPNTAAPKERIV